VTVGVTKCQKRGIFLSICRGYTKREEKVNYLVRISTIIRLILTAALLYGIYTETGIWTTITLTLVAIAGEIKSARK